MEIADLLAQYKNKILNIVILIIALMVANNIFKAQNQSLNQLRQEKEIQVKKNKTLSDISQLEVKLAAYKSLTGKKDLSAALSAINNIAKETQVKVSSIKPEKEINTAYFTQYPFSLVVKMDSYHKLGKFIARLESHLDIYSVEALSIQEERAERGESALSANLIVNTIAIKN
jgi:Tfp pilus assembly protein PilO